jgi:hypothetical protein
MHPILKVGDLAETSWVSCRAAKGRCLTNHGVEASLLEEKSAKRKEMGRDYSPHKSGDRQWMKELQLEPSPMYESDLR